MPDSTASPSAPESPRPSPRKRRPSARQVGFWLGLILFFATLFFADFAPGQPLVTRMAAVALLMAAWWISEAIPLAATSLLPLVLFPLLGIMTGKETAPVYVNYIVFLYVGGFLIALAMQRWRLHKRIALNIVRTIGGTPARLVLGFMAATAFLSMWISNTATTIMMLAIALAVIGAEEERFGREKTATLSVALLLGIAYSASVGGMATLVGTPPNLVLVRVFDQTFPGAAAAGEDIGFGQWMLFGLPLSAILLLVAWLLLTKVLFRPAPGLEYSRDAVRDELRQLGRPKREEWIVLAVFAATSLLWVFRKDLAIGEFTLPGWSGLLPFGSHIDDGTIAVAMALLLFLVPARNRVPGDGQGGTADGETAADSETEAKAGKNGRNPGAILDPGVFARIPWHIILLFGGGFALAKGFHQSGLSEWVGSFFTELGEAPAPVLVAGVSTGLTFLTELTSNTATTELLLPLLASIAQAAEVHPLLLMIPAAISASCAFMMPVATPPNAIVFGSGRIRIAQMVKAGIVINLLAIALTTLLFSLLGPPIFGIDPGEFPAWAGGVVESGKE